MPVDPYQSLRTLLGVLPSEEKETEIPPEETIDVPKGCNYCKACLLYGIAILVFMYISGVASDFFFTVMPKVASGDCAQNQWNTTKEEACQYLMTTALTIGIDPRCYREKPPGMSEEDFKTACDDWWGVLLGVAFFGLAACCYAVQVLEKFPGEVEFYRDCMTVIASNGNDYQVLFYADVTDAELSSGRIKLSAKAIASYTVNANSKPRTLSIQGETSVEIVCDEDDDGETIESKLARRLSVPIKGSDASPGDVDNSMSMLAGRLQQVIDTRSSSGSAQTLKIPKTCDLATDVIITFLVIVAAWYLFSVLGNLFSWAERNATGKCKELDHPDIDFCNVSLIFWPIQTLSDWAAYLQLVFLIIGLLVVAPLKVAWSIDQSYNFDQDKFWRAPCEINEAQELNVMFWDDISKAEAIDTSMEKAIRLEGGVTFTLTGGVKDPFQVTARFKDAQTQDIKIVDPGLASCCCQGKAALTYNRGLQSVARKFMPAVDISEAIGSDESSEEGLLSE